MAVPVEEKSRQDLVWYREEGNLTVVFTFLGVTLSFPDQNDNAPSLFGRDNPRVSNRTQKSVQPQKCGGSPRLEHLCVDAAHALLECRTLVTHGNTWPVSVVDV